MTLYIITVKFEGSLCDWCEKEIYVGAKVWYNPKTKTLLHQGACQELAESG